MNKITGALLVLAGCVASLGSDAMPMLPICLVSGILFLLVGIQKDGK